MTLHSKNSGAGKALVFFFQILVDRSGALFGKIQVSSLKWCIDVPDAVHAF